MLLTETPGEVLKRFMKERNISSVQVAHKLGYKSHTSVIRLLNGQVNHSAVNEFMRRLTLTDGLLLTADEHAELMRALESSRFDADVLAGLESLWKYLFSATEYEPDISFKLFQEEQSAVMLTAKQLCETLQSAKRMEIDIFDCCYEPFFAFLSRCLPETDGKSVIRHYMHLNSSAAEPIRAMICAAMMTRYRKYEGMARMNTAAPTTGSKWAPAFLADKAFIWIADGESQCLYIIHAVPQEPYCVYCIQDARQYRRMFAVWTEGYKNSYVNIRTHYLYPEISENLLLLSQRLLFMEENRSQRTYRPALCFNHLAPELIEAPVVKLLGIPSDSPVVESLRDIHRRRYMNAFTMQAPAWLVLTVDGMWQMAQTGYLPDHIKGMEPLSTSALIRSYQDLADAADRNPFFHFNFFLDDTPMHRLMISSYEGIGAYFIDPAGPMDPQPEGFYEAVLPAEDFYKVYTLFFDQVLIGRHTYSEDESKRILNEMIRWLKEQSDA